MNKIISIVLLCSLLLMCLSSCAYVDKIFGNKDNEPENLETPNQDDPQNEDGKPVELQATDERVVELLEYIEELSWSCQGSVPYKFSSKVDCVKNGGQALLVNYQSSETYFICGYYTEDYEPIFHWDAPKYTWVKFENENEITETYNNLILAIAFQFNVANAVTDIVTRDAEVPNVEFYQEYTPIFNEALNTNTAIAFDRIFLHPISNENSKKDSIYYSAFESEYYSLSLLYFNYQYYIIEYHYTSKSDGTNTAGYLAEEFGEYYDALSKVMITNEYCRVNENGDASFYVLIKFEDFVNLTN